MSAAYPCRGSGTGSLSTICSLNGNEYQHIPDHPAPQATQHRDGQVHRWGSSSNSLGFSSAPQQERKTSSGSVDKRNTEVLALCSLSSPGQLGRGGCGGGGGCGQQEGERARRLCPFPVTEGASSSKRKSSELGVQTPTHGSTSEQVIILSRISGPAGRSPTLRYQQAAILTFVSGIVLSRMRFKQIISGRQLKGLEHNR